MNNPRKEGKLFSVTFSVKAIDLKSRNLKFQS